MVVTITIQDKPGGEIQVAMRKYNPMGDNEAESPAYLMAKKIEEALIESMEESQDE